MCALRSTLHRHYSVRSELRSNLHRHYSVRSELRPKLHLHYSVRSEFRSTLHRHYSVRSELRSNLHRHTASGQNCALAYTDITITASDALPCTDITTSELRYNLVPTLQPSELCSALYRHYSVRSQNCALRCTNFARIALYL